MYLRPHPLNEQEQLVVFLRDVENLTTDEIAARLGVSIARVNQLNRAISAKLKDFAEHGKDALSLLPGRVRRVVEECGIGSRALARFAIVTGRLTWNEGMGGMFWNGVMIRAVSRKTWAVLYEWAGRPPLPNRPGQPAPTSTYRWN
jgi:predicted DNA-binding protein (UPF0251 family)